LIQLSAACDTPVLFLLDHTTESTDFTQLIEDEALQNSLGTDLIPAGRAMALSAAASSSNSSIFYRPRVPIRLELRTSDRPPNSVGSIDIV
jgi:hypothetical protein